MAVSVSVAPVAPHSLSEEELELAHARLQADALGAGSGAAGRLSRRAVALTVAAAAALALCGLLAGAFAAASASSASLWETASPADAEPGIAGDVEAFVNTRRLDAGTGGALGCSTPKLGDPCFRHVQWAMQNGIQQRPDLYPGLSSESSFEDVQAALHIDPFAQCPRPCALKTASQLMSLSAQEPDDEAAAIAWEQLSPNEDAEVHAMLATALSTSVLGWQHSDRLLAQGRWCSVEEPVSDWKIRGCGRGNGLQLKVLTYNLFWWNLFGRRHGNGGSAGRLISGNSLPQPYDLLGFQECEGLGWVLGDAGLADEYAGLTGPHALCLAYRKSEWLLLSDGATNVGEDRPDQWYGTRAAMWVRLLHRTTGQTVMFMNHHGPLPVGSGGLCGGEATAYNLLKLIASEAHEGDVIVLVGDFNAGPETATVKSLHGHLFPAFTGSSFGGVDHVLSSCTSVNDTRNLGDGGSDHDALEVIFQL